MGALLCLCFRCWDHCANNESKWVSVSAHELVLLSLSPCMRVYLGIAAQTEATLISVLESNLACVQNGSLYQLGGSLPCLESGGSRSSGSSDAFLLTAQREQPHNHLLQRLAEKGHGKTIYALLLICLWSCINGYHFKGSQGCYVLMTYDFFKGS